MMITDSVFSVISPYLWLGDVFVDTKWVVICYSISSTLFYLTNTLFACLLIYLTHYFGTELADSALNTTDKAYTDQKDSRYFTDEDETTYERGSGGTPTR